jgi:hypothetical protein
MKLNNPFFVLQVGSTIPYYYEATSLFFFPIVEFQEPTLSLFVEKKKFILSLITLDHILILYFNGNTLGPTVMCFLYI